ncbi:isochorismatase family protein [Shimia sp.]|uniref:isochorismatase family protein n=1 Tax=Shimia sp. TaxID=1954381 RepID=UPI0032968819
MTDILLLIDVQQAILDGAAGEDRLDDVVGYFTEMVTRLADLKSSAADQGIQTILVQNDGPDGHRLAIGSVGWEIVPALSANAGDIVVHKKSCDSFHETDLMEHLQRLGASRLVVGGCMTQFCVDTSVRRAVSLGFDVVLISDGHCTGDTDVLKQNEIIAHHNQTLNGFDAGDHAVTVMSSADFAFRS